MLPLFAYHRTHKFGDFKHATYATKSKKPRIGDQIYVISANGDKHPNYSLEGLYQVYASEPIDLDERKLILRTLLRQPTRILLNDQPWFDNAEFQQLFAPSLTLSSVQPDYDTRFRELLGEAKAAD